MTHEKLPVLTPKRLPQAKSPSGKPKWSILSAILSAFEAYGAALCGHVPKDCAIEEAFLHLEAKPSSPTASESRTKTFAAVRDRSNHALPTVMQCQL